MNIIEDWLKRDAKWYQFWLPRSGAPGEAIMGLIVGIIIFVWFK